MLVLLPRLALRSAGVIALTALASSARAQGRAENAACDRAVAEVPADVAQAERTAREQTALGAFYRACLLMKEEKWDAALDAFERLTRESGGNAVLHYWVGRAAAEKAQRANVLKQPGLARKVKGAFERSVQLDPTFIDAREGIMQYYLLAPGVMGGSVDRARAQVEEIRRLSPYRGAILAARIAQREKDLPGAEREYQRLATELPDSVGAWTSLVSLQLQQKKWDDASRTIERFAAAHPSAMIVQYMTGRAAAESGRDLDRGEQALRRYLSYTPKASEPSHAAATWRLGMIAEARGQKAEARARYESALKLDPKLEGAKEGLRRVK